MPAQKPSTPASYMGRATSHSRAHIAPYPLSRPATATRSTPGTGRPRTARPRTATSTTGTNSYIIAAVTEGNLYTSNAHS
jgi:hypothetical protein